MGENSKNVSVPEVIWNISFTKLLMTVLLTILQALQVRNKEKIKQTTALDKIQLCKEMCLMDS